MLGQREQILGFGIDSDVLDSPLSALALLCRVGAIVSHIICQHGPCLLLLCYNGQALCIVLRHLNLVISVVVLQVILWLAGVLAA